ncbi:MAG: UbiA family prenyltransferase [Thermoanaerobaculia bacterium]
MKNWITLTRPFTLLPPLLGIISGAICAWGSVHNPDPTRAVTATVVLTIVLGSLCASFLNAASNVLNQIYDLEIDRVNKPRRPLVTAAVGMREAWIGTVILYLLAIIPTWLVVVFPYNGVAAKFFAPLPYHECLFIYIAGMIFTFVYSAPAFGRTKRFGIWANLTIAIPRGTLLKVAGWSMVAHVFSTEPWFIGGIFGLFLLGAASTKDYSDIEGDRRGGCQTLPIRYGVRASAWMIAPFFVFPWILMPIGAHVTDPFLHGAVHPILTGNATLLTAVGIILVLWGSYTAWLLLRNPDELTSTENHPSWRHMYLMMMFAQVGFAVSYLF